MQELRSIEINILLDMLADKTTEYFKLAQMGNEMEYAKCALSLKAIQAEIEFRKRNAANTNVTDPNIIIR